MSGGTPAGQFFLKIHLNYMNIGFEAKRIFHNKTGLGNYSRDLVRILSHFFPDNTYFLYNPRPSGKALYRPNNSNVFEKHPSGFINRTFHNLWRQKRIIKDLRKDQLSLFHGLSGELPSGLKRSGIKSIVTVHDLIFLKFPQFYSFFDRKIHTYKFRKATENADMVIAISEQTRQDIITYFGIPGSKIRVIYQGCQDVFRQKYSTEQKEEVRKKFKLPSRFILNVGTIEIRKNILAAVKAIREIDTHLVIIGSHTKYSREIFAYLKDNRMENKVTFLKGVSSEELAVLYQAAELFIYPSLYEGFGIPIIEALFSGTPVITSTGSCFPEAGGPGSVYINPHDPETIQFHIHRLLNDPGERARIAAEGRLYARQFADAHIAGNIMNLYKEVINRSAS